MEGTGHTVRDKLGSKALVIGNGYLDGSIPFTYFAISDGSGLGFDPQRG
jgi:hypothetical protein